MHDIHPPDRAAENRMLAIKPGLITVSIIIPSNYDQSLKTRIEKIIHIPSSPS